MKRIMYCIIALLCTMNFLYGQNGKEKVAVYASDKTGSNMGLYVGGYLTDVIVKRGKYVAVERTEQFLAELNKEQSFQRTGAVDDSQISRLGKNMGVQFVCIVNIERGGGQQLYISARLVDVETAEVKATARPVLFDNWNETEEACKAIVASMFGGVSGGMSHEMVNSSMGRSHAGEPEMVFVEGGTFIMGCTSEQGDDCYSDESPNHLVTVSDFYIGKYEVTQAQWEAVMGTSVSQQRDKAGETSLSGVGSNYPMYYVSWTEVQEFISRLNALTGKEYRLPTEAEWEYAARGGNKSKGYKYSGSNFIEQVAWYKSNSGNSTHPVGSKSPNELGIYDMSGNVYEWCYDRYGSYGSGAETNPVGPSSGERRVVRGGGWNSIASDCRVAIRYDITPSDRYCNLGFRLVLSR